MLGSRLALHRREIKSLTLDKGSFHLSELTGQTILVVMRISLLIKLSSSISQILNSIRESSRKESVFQQKLFEKLRSMLN